MPEKLLTPLQLVEQATPAVPDAGALGIYPKTDDNLYSQNSAGRELPIGFDPYDVPLGNFIIPDNCQMLSGRDLTIENGFLYVLGDMIETVEMTLAGAGVAGTAARSDILSASNVGLYRIADFLLTVTTASITFSAIPGLYRNLIVDWQGRSDTAANNTDLRYQLNGDTGGNYDTEHIYLNASTVALSGGETIAGTSGIAGEMVAANATAGFTGGGRISIPNYSGTAFQKLLVAQCSFKFAITTSSFYSCLDASFWRNAAAVTSITFFPLAGSFITGTSFQLYGEL